MKHRFILIGCAALAVTAACMSDADTGPAPSQPSDIEAVMSLEGKQFEIVGGKLYEVRRQFVQDVYDPSFHARSYTTENGRVYRVFAGGSRRLPVYRDYVDGFEQASTIRDLISEARGWTAMTVLGPAAPTVDAYAQLRQRILHGESDFKDNRIEPSALRAHGGERSLRAYVVAAPSSLKVAKASLSNELLYLRQGDTVTVEGYFFIEKGMPTTLIDLESSFIDQGSGLRVLLTPEGKPRVELKWPTRPVYDMPAGMSYRFETGAWIGIRLEALLENDATGWVRLFADGEKLIDVHGPTLPLPNLVYDRLEIGITAAPPGQEVLLYVDDVSLSVR